MAFQAMNHGLEARAASPPRIEATDNLPADSALVLLLPLIRGYAPPPSSPRKRGSKSQEQRATGGSPLSRG